MSVSSSRTVSGGPWRFPSPKGVVNSSANSLFTSRCWCPRLVGRNIGKRVRSVGNSFVGVIGYDTNSPWDSARANDSSTSASRFRTVVFVKNRCRYALAGTKICCAMFFSSEALSSLPAAAAFSWTRLRMRSILSDNRSVARSSGSTLRDSCVANFTSTVPKLPHFVTF